MQCWLAALQLSLRARGVLAGKASPQPLTNGDRADAEQQTRRGSWTGQLESGKANGVRKEGLEGGYICLDNVCIFFFFPPKTESALDITNGACVPWVVSAALAPTPISPGVPAGKGS